MDIRQLLWDDVNVEHIARHRVTPEEVEDVCFDQMTLFTRAGSRRYQATGQSRSGRYLVVFLDRLEKGSYYPVTARPADEGE